MIPAKHTHVRKGRAHLSNLMPKSKYEKSGVKKMHVEMMAVRSFGSAKRNAIAPVAFMRTMDATLVPNANRLLTLNVLQKGDKTATWVAAFQNRTAGLFDTCSAKNE